MKRHIHLAAFATLLGALSSWLIFTQVYAQGNAQGGRIDSSTFLIPYAVDQLDEQFNAGRLVPLNITNIETTISIAVQRNDTIIYYDHWEDGLEGDLTFPTQNSTEIWGDDDPANGIPPFFTSDVLTNSSIITLRNFVPVDYNDRDPTNPFLFDGGDVLSGAGGPLAVTLMFWPQGPGVLYTDAWELYPTNHWSTDYIVPIGQNLAGLRAGFSMVGLNVQALQDGTDIQIDITGDGIIDIAATLDYGEQYNTIDGVSSGARVQASAPVQVQVIATDPTQTYEARGYTVVPVSQWTHDYLAPRSSDGDFWLYNPDPTNPLEIRAQSVTATTIITIPPGSTTKFPPGNAITITIPTAMHFTSIFTPPGQPRPFYSMVALDAGAAQDWGYDVLPTDNLTSQTLVGLGIGNNSDPIPPFNPNGDQSPVYVAVTQTTTIFVDYNNDGLVDFSSLITPLAEVAITDPDHDLTGAFIFTQDDTPFAAVWGQDQGAPPALPSIDAGAGLIPLPSLLIQKTFTLLEDVDCTGLISSDDTVRFKLEYFNNTVTLISHVTIADTMPSALAYLPNSIVVDGVSIPDSAGNTLFAGGYDIGTVAGLESGILTFDAQVRSTTDPIINQAGARSQDVPLESDSVTIFVPTGVVTPALQLGATLLEPVDGVITAGQAITFGLTITNTGSVTITKLPLQNDFSETYLTFLKAAPPPNVTATGAITWSDLVTNFGQLPPDASINLTISYGVDQLPPTPQDVFNKMTVINARQSNSPLSLTCSTEANVNIAAPTPTHTPTPTSSATPTSTSTPITPIPPIETATATPAVTSRPTEPPKDEGTPVPSSTPPAKLTPSATLLLTATLSATATLTATPSTATPTATSLPTAPSTPPFPVGYLPATGSQAFLSGKVTTGGPLLLLTLLGLSAITVWLSENRRR